MGIMGSEQLTQLTDIHRKVSKRIERLGISVRDEVPFPPYTVDIYLDEYHVVVEVDGPHHNQKKDDKRDQELWDKYHLYVLHIPSGEAKKASHVKKIVLDFIEKSKIYDSVMADESIHRRKYAEDNGWLL